MNICMLVYNYHPLPTGGAERQCRLQAHELVRQGHHCTVLTARNRADLQRREDDNGVQVVRLSVLQPFVDRLVRVKSRLSARRINAAAPDLCRSSVVQKECISVRTVDKISAWLQAGVLMFGLAAYLFRNRRTIDLIHTHVASWNAGYAGWLGARLKIPVLCKAAYLPAFHDYGRSVPFPKLWYQWRKRIHYIALTPEMARDIAGQGVSPNRIRVIPNGVVLPTQCAAVTGRTVLYVGNFTQGSEHKGFDVLVDAWAYIHRLVPDARLTVIGAGDATPWVERATSLGCLSSINFAGYVADMESVYRQASLLLLPSRGEGISNALLEAQSYGLPAIVSNIPGNRAVVVDGQTGYVVQVDDPEAMGRKAVALLQEPARLSAMGEQARQRISEQFSIAVVVKKIGEYYRDLLRHRSIDLI